MIVTLNENVKKYGQEYISDRDNILKIRDATQLLLKLMFFFSSVSSTTTSSAKMAKSIIISDHLFTQIIPGQQSFIRSFIMDNINQLSIEKKSNDDREGYISLERLNIIVSTSDFGENFLLNNNFFQDLLSNKKLNLDYFNIISLLYYFKNHDEYSDLKSQIEERASELLVDGNNFLFNSESAHLFLDLICCPYISDNFKKRHLQSFFASNNRRKSKADIASFIKQIKSSYWFVKWKNLNLLKLLERKELKSPY